MAFAKSSRKERLPKVGDRLMKSISFTQPHMATINWSHVWLFMLMRKRIIT